MNDIAKIRTMPDSAIVKAHSCGAEILPGLWGVDVINNKFNLRTNSAGEARCCLLGACLLGSDGADYNKKDYCAAVSDLLNVSPNWIESFIIGFDNVSNFIEVQQDAYNIGQEYRTRILNGKQKI